ncbi:unnamed protein product [Calicophoron daubneyi]|uniref:Uncharacterized protein n=1 Tax=Calicophoron daubneyi TaxID=300641 RepID=A0AAV2THF5_CALDB
MPNSPQFSQVPTVKTYNISVVGPPKAGKSCLCNRFALPHPDYYRKDHLSVLSAADFVGEIVNRDSWLYWGCVTRQVEDYTVNFRIIEQTQFLDDSTFQPFAVKKSSDDASLQEYIQRSSALRLSSEHKLRYICKEQVGQENVYEREYFPSGEVEINGFILVYDISPHHVNSDQRHSKNCTHRQQFIQDFLAILLKLKKPIVVAFSKLDVCNQRSVEELSSLLQKSSEFKKIPLIETSAHRNINIEQTFVSLVKLIDKPRTIRLKFPRYLEALKERLKCIDQATAGFSKLISHAPCEFLGSWDAFTARYSQQTDVVTYVQLVGTSSACRKFEQLINERQKKNKQIAINQIAGLLRQVLPSLDPVRDRSIDGIVEYIREQKQFSVYFRDAPPNSILPVPPKPGGFQSKSKSEDPRIPFSFVTDPQDDETESPLEQYVNQLTEAEHKHYEKALLESVLHQYAYHPRVWEEDNFSTPADSGFVLPGQPISDIKHILDSVEIHNLTDEDVAEVYKDFQVCLHARAREDFLDLMLERTDVFIEAILTYLRQLQGCLYMDAGPRCVSANSLVDLPSKINTAYPTSKADILSSATHINPSQHLNGHGTGKLDPVLMLAMPPRGAKENQLALIESHLSKDWRYKSMSFLPSERQTLMTSHFSMLLPTSLPSRRPSVIKSSISGNVNDARRRFAELNCASVDAASTNVLPAINPFIPASRPQSAVQLFDQVSSSGPGDGYCSSLRWGGCMDQLLKQLSYCQLPVNPLCLDADRLDQTKADSKPKMLCSEYPGGNFDRLHPRSFSETSSYPSCDPTLSVGMACACSDTEAAQALMQLLSCAGFSMTTFLTHDAFMKSASDDFNLKNMDEINDTHLLPEFTTQSLVLSSSWPLSTDRLPAMNFAQLDGFMQSVTVGRNGTHSHHGGQIQAHPMSLHKMLSGILANAADTRSAESSTNRFSFGENNCKKFFDGYIFVISVPSEKKYNNTVNLPNRSGSVESKKAVISECNKIPGFPETDDHSGQRVSASCIKSNKCSFFTGVTSTHNLSFESDEQANDCRCCTLFDYQNFNCCCSRCCKCLSASTNAGDKRQVQLRESVASCGGGNPASDLTTLAFPHRLRSWKSRIAAVNSIIEQLPKSVPHLVLLTYGGPSYKDTNSLIPRVDYSNFQFYPAPECLFRSNMSSDMSEECEAQSPRNGNASLWGQNNASNQTSAESSASEGDRCPSEWIPNQTILDHVIQFLGRCWNSVDIANLDRWGQVQTVDSRDRFLYHSTSAFEPVVARSVASATTRSPRDACQDPTTSGNKSSTNSLFTAASATGRRAMQSANQALKKFSSSARRHHGNSSPACSISEHPGSAPRNEVAASRSDSSGRVLGAIVPSVSAHFRPVVSHSASFTSVKNSAANSTDRTACTHLVEKPKGSSTPESRDDCAPYPVIWTLESVLQDSVHNENVSYVESSLCTSTVTTPGSPPGSGNVNPLSIEHAGVIRNGAPVFGISGRFRCSVPDCTLLASSEDRNKPLESNRNSSSSTLVPSSPLFRGPPSPLHSTVSSLSSTARRDISAGYYQGPLPVPSSSMQTASKGIPDPTFVCADETVPRPLEKGAAVSLDNSLVSGTSPLSVPLNACSLSDELVTNVCDTDNQRTLCPTEHPYSNCCAHPVAHYEIESIYEELELALPQQSHASEAGTIGRTYAIELPARFPCAADCGSKEHIYMDPVDCVGPANVERHRESGRFLLGMNFQENHPSPEEAGNRFCAISSSINPITRPANLHRERTRSFSTPEGSSSNTAEIGGKVGSISDLLTCCYSSVLSNSPLARGKSLQFPNSRNESSFHQFYETLRKAPISNSKGATSTSCSISHSSPRSQHIHSATDAASPTGFHSPSQPINSSITGQSLYQQCPNFVFSEPSIAYAHHHHFWHHFDCPHYKSHPVMPDSALTTARTSNAYEKLNELNNSGVPVETNVKKTASVTNGAQPVKPGMSLQRLTPRPVSGPVGSSKNLFSGSLFNSTSPSDSSAINGGRKGSSFVTHSEFHPHQSHSHGKSSGSVFNNTFTTKFNAGSPSDATLSHPAAQKSFKWSRRGKKLNFFHNHRLSAHAHCTTPLTAAATVSSTPNTTTTCQQGQADLRLQLPSAISVQRPSSGPLSPVCSNSSGRWVENPKSVPAAAFPSRPVSDISTPLNATDCVMTTQPCTSLCSPGSSFDMPFCTNFTAPVSKISDSTCIKPETSCIPLGTIGPGSSLPILASNED